MKFVEMTIEQLEKLYSDKLLELRELDAEFTTCKVDERNAKTQLEKQDIAEWRVQAAIDKKNIVSELQEIRAQIKIQKSAAGDYITVAEAHRQSMLKFDRIIELLEGLQ